MVHSKLHFSFRPRRSRAAGFTLTEVALAIGIVAFAFVALLALLPAGQTAYRRAVDISVCSQIAQRVINDAQQSDFDTLIDQIDTTSAQAADPTFTFRAPLISNPSFRYFDDQGREVTPAAGKTTNIPNVIYVVNTRITPWYQLPYQGVPTATGTAAVSPQPLAMVTIQVAHNPGANVTLPLSTAPASGTDPERNLWASTNPVPGIEIYTYTGYVARNF